MFFADPNGYFEGMCVYLDGMSKHLHGDPARRELDRQIREELRNRFYEVFEITRTEVDDPNKMQQHFYRLGRLLLGKDAAERIRNDKSWFRGGA